MNKQEATHLLALIKLSYPTAYRDLDDVSKKATVNMWQMSFPDVPYPIMEQAFNHFRLNSKFPPTVAEMVEELKRIHLLATENALVCKGIGNEEMVRKYRAVMDLTARYKNPQELGGLNIDSLPMLEGYRADVGIGPYGGGEGNVQGLGTPGDRVDREDRLPLLDAGEGEWPGV